MGARDRVRRIGRLAQHHAWVLLPAVVVISMSYRWRRYQLDDALIYLRYVRNFRAGDGLVYNPGDHFNGLTSPLYTYVLAAGSFVTQQWQLLSIGLAAVIFLAACILFGLTFGDSRTEAAVIATGLSLCGYMYSTFGMETPLFLAALATALLLRHRGSDYAVVALAVVIGTRTEGALLLIPFALEQVFLIRRRPAVRPLLVAAGVVALPFVVGLSLYGELLPGTARAKLGQGRSGFWDDHNSFLSIGRLRDVYLDGNHLAVLLLVLLVLAGIGVSIRHRRTQHALVFLCLLFLFYWGFNLPNYHWYYAPFIAFAVVFVMKAVHWCVAGAVRSATQSRPTRQMLVGAVAVVAFGFLCIHAVAPSATGRNERYTSIGEWIRTNTPPDTSVGLLEIGTVGWYSDRPIVDILGLVNEYNSRYIADRDLYSWLASYQPDLILRFDPPSFWDVAAVAAVEAGAYEVMEDPQVRGLALLRKTGDVSDAEIAALMRSLRDGSADDLGQTTGG